MARRNTGARARSYAGGINIAASAPGWASSIKAVRAMPREVQTAVSRRGRSLAEPLAKEIRAEGTSQGSHAASVATTVVASVKAGTPTVNAKGKPYTMGSEWGGRLRTRTYYSTSPLGRRFLIVTRHTTMQFRPHRGNEGYWFTPTIHEGKGREAVLQAWADLVDDVLRTF